MANKIKYDRDSLLYKFREVNGDLYEYDLSNFINTGSYIDVICGIHGRFKQRVSNHLRGQGCKRCASSSPTKDTKKLLAEFYATHKNTYSYTNMNFIGVQNKIEIICKTHGSFWQRPHDHKNGRGCPKCVGFSLDEIINRAVLIHGYSYDYSNATLEIKNGFKMLKNIKCDKHGYFFSHVHNHLKGHKCKRCAVSHHKKSTIEDRITSAMSVHGNLYQYSIESPTGSKEKAIITCPIHGEFKQTWANHISGKQGCKKCNRVTGRYTEDYFIMYPERKDISASLYVISMVDGDTKFYKIGITTNFKNRMKHIPYVVNEILLIDDTLFNVYRLEQKFLNSKGYCNRYIPAKKFGGDKECFILPIAEILNFLS